MIVDLLTPQGPRGRGQPFCFAVARPIYVSNTHTKFDWISPNGLGGDSIMDGRTDRRTDGQTYGRTEAIIISLSLFLKKAWE